MTAAPPRAAGSEPAEPSRFPLALAASAAHPSRGPFTVRWRFPALPVEADALAASVGLRILADASAGTPQSLPSFAAVFAHARAEQVVRALAARTNFVLPGASALVVGDGPIADAIAGTLAHGGSRVIRAIDDPVARLRAHLTGMRTTTSNALAADSELLLVTGEGHPPVDQSGRQGTAIDASPDGSGLIGAPGRPIGAAAGAARPYVRGAGTGSWVVEAPPVFAEDSPLSLRIADVLIALSILAARTDDADALLAELVLA